MTAWRLITRSLIHHWRINTAVALGVMAATAVLTGALLVGDSVRGSLRALTLERLGRIQYVLVTDRFFRAELAEEIAQMEGFDQHFERTVPAILFPAASVEHVDPERPELASNVTVIASTEDFWQLGDGPTPRVLPSSNQVVLNEPLAGELGIEVGDLVTLRLPSADDVPADSPLGDRRERVQGLPRLEVVDVLPAEGLGRFSMR